MFNSSVLNCHDKQAIISLHDYSHEVCVAATQLEYWQQLIKRTNIMITCHGEYIPKEFDLICNEINKLQLHLIIQTQNENDKKQIDRMRIDIHRTFLLGEQNCNINELENTFNCSIIIDKLSSKRYRFTIRHEKLIIMDLVGIQIQSIVRQVQSQYVIAFARYFGRSLLNSMERIENDEKIKDQQIMILDKT
ncbi:hypothetical protein I4U23_010388 [Adineta vaga]|nr:hypothetical protein I4U23_010388 [Adineta vaga]